MTEFLFLVTLVLAALLWNTRNRLARLERLFQQGMPDAEPAPEPDQRRSAVIVDRPAAAAEPAPVRRSAIIVDAPPPVEPAPTMEEPDAPAEPVLAVPLPAAEPAQQPVRASTSFEDLFGRKLPIWAGGITLIVAAVLLVKYSIDAGLLSPTVRVLLGLVFGAGLIGGAEVARRKADLVQDDRVAQALAGAGIGSLYAATLAGANLYGLFSPGIAFAGLCLITALAIGLSLRFGAPCAVLGLVGGLATPALVDSGEGNVPLLAGYLAIVIGGLTLLSRRQRWVWLGVSALIGGGAWSALLIVTGGLDQLSALSVGLLVLMLGIGLPIVAATDHHGPLLRVVAAMVAALQLALLVATGGYAPLIWGLYGLLSMAFIWLTTRMPTLRATVAVPLLTALILATTWPEPPFGQFVAVMAGIVLSFAGSALWRVWRADGGPLEAAQLAVTAIGGLFVAYFQFNSAPLGEDTQFALLAICFALLPAAGVALGWSKAERQGDHRFATLALSAGLLVSCAAILGLSEWTIPVSIALIAGGLLLVGETAPDGGTRHGALAFLGVALLMLMGTGSAVAELNRLSQPMPMLDHPLQALLRWVAALMVTSAFSWRFAGSMTGKLLQGIAAVLAYGLVAQFLPAVWLAIAAALGMLAAVEAGRHRPALGLTIAPAVLALIAALWALEPLARWLLAGAESLAGDPVFVADLPTSHTALQYLFLPALIGCVALWRQRDDLHPLALRIASAQMGAVALIGVHILYKQLFAIGDTAGFVALGLAERTLWELLLIGAGLAIGRVRPDRREPLVLVGLGLAHNLIYSLLLHDPLWASQAVGPWPLANLLLPAFAIAFAGPSLIGHVAPALAPRLPRPGAILRMIVILLFAYASLRQLFAGSLLTARDVSATESICWSVLAIALAIGYLLWGIRTGQRAWRIGSLLLMLAAVAKVFLLDASGLEGLLRILSFLALGFSLIGIGWLYSRYLRPDATAT
ncbi:DUF2339 domain-containing protein [Sphingobium nicotianae]|uniref:DUF2339 domain-containing protein n=1 Tax=Sphingobium nicotianae TaxID=2782607 RepID=A0A9X1DFK3_9SPHN|nr:DUF2339 domain-containing protein [Sphingobium nicotianae]MBT2189116.1 DUF2339 domain-containing protein [Sphingobium nicotianae]